LRPWWAARGDTLSLKAIARVLDSVQRLPKPPVSRGVLRYYGASTQAYLALARRDSTSALRQFLALPDTLCPQCALEQATRVDLLLARGRDQDAAPLLDREWPEPLDYEPVYVSWIMRRARVNDRLGNRDKAIASYKFVADVWKHADAELQPLVVEARTALTRLTGEPRR
jgi:hypothetical protein